MVALNHKEFRPAVPRTSPRLLAGNYAQVAVACKLQGGVIDPFRGPALTRTSSLPVVLSMARYRASGVDYWLEWAVAGVDVARSPNRQDSRNRVYWSGDGEPRMAAFADAVSGVGSYPGAWFVLGVYIPTTAPTISTSGGSGSEDRSYIHTLVTQYGEEGAPCPIPALGTGPSSGGTWTLSGLEAPPPNSGTISAATTVSSGVVRVTLNTARGLAQYEQITLAGAGGMTDLNGTHAILAVDIGAGTIDIALSTAQTYTSGGTWARRAPHNTTGMRRRIYRTVGTNGTYLFVADIPATDTSFADTVAGTALGAECPTIDSYTPPKNGHSLRELANGSFAMLAGNEVCFSEIGKPHSWPIGNRYSFAGIGVAQVVVENSCVITTDSAPVIAVATTPDRAQLAKIEDCNAGNLSKLGTVDTGSGAAYPSTDGYWHVTPSGAYKLTEKLFTFDQWQALLPQTMRAAYQDGKSWIVHDNPDGSSGMLLLEFSGQNLPDGVVEVDDDFAAVYENPYDGRLYVARDDKIYLWDEDDTNRYLAMWRGPSYQLGGPTNLSVAQVHAEYGDIAPVDLSIQEANEAALADYEGLDGPLAFTPMVAVPLAGTGLREQPPQTPRRVQFTLLEGERVRFTRDVSSSKPFRLPAGFKAELLTMQISASTRVYSVTVAQGIDELKAASQ